MAGGEGMGRNNLPANVLEFTRVKRLGKLLAIGLFLKAPGFFE